MITGVLIAESLRVGATLEGVPLTARKLWRIAIEDPMVEQPSAWTLIQFEAAEADGPRLAAALAAVLDDAPGWYADFHSPTEKVRGVPRAGVSLSARGPRCPGRGRGARPLPGHPRRPTRLAGLTTNPRGQSLCAPATSGDILIAPCR
jgi:hypothetical protein